MCKHRQEVANKGSRCRERCSSEKTGRRKQKLAGSNIKKALKRTAVSHGLWINSRIWSPGENRGTAVTDYSERCATAPRRRNHIARYHSIRAPFLMCPWAVAFVISLCHYLDGNGFDLVPFSLFLADELEFCRLEETMKPSMGSVCFNQKCIWECWDQSV